MKGVDINEYQAHLRRDIDNLHCIIIVKGKYPYVSYNYVEADLKPRLDKWYPYVRVIGDGFLRCVVHLKSGSIKCLDRDGVPIHDELFKGVSEFHKGFGMVVSDNNLMNLIDKDGKFLCERWWESVSPIKDGYALIEENGLFGFVKTDGTVGCEPSYARIYGFYEGRAVVTDANRSLQNHIRYEDGELVSKTWWSKADSFKNGFAVVVDTHGAFHHIGLDGKMVPGEGWENARDFHHGFAAVENGKGLWNHIDTEGKLLSDRWWDLCGDFCLKDGSPVCCVKDTNGYHIIDSRGNVSDKADEYLERISALDRHTFLRVAPALGLLRNMF